MKKNRLFSAVLSLFLLVPASITWAQTISSQKGLTTAVFNISAGTIKVYLPTGIRPGDQISGMVIAEPIGKNEKQIAKNLATLRNCAVNINGEKILPDNTNKPFQVSLPTGKPVSCQIELTNASGKKESELTIPTIPEKQLQKAPGHCMIPSHALTGAPFWITGAFDGNSSNTNCSIGNKPMEVLAESPRQCIVTYPAESSGSKTLNVQENGRQQCSSQVIGVNMELSAGKLDLVKGEKTYIEVSITGLQNLPDTALLTLTNITTSVVIMQPANIVVIPLTKDISANGIFNRRFDIQSIRNGGFTVNVNLDLPDVMLSPAPGDGPGPGPKVCQCFVKAGVAIFKDENGVTTFMATPYADCTGEKCAYKNDIAFTWKINSGNAEIIDIDNSGFFVKVKNKGGAGFSIFNTATVTCSDGTSCSDDIYFDKTGTEIPGPGGKIDEPKIVSTPDKPRNNDTIPDINTKICNRTVTEDPGPKMNGGLKTGVSGKEESYVNIPLERTIQRDDFVPLAAEGLDYDLLKISCVPGSDCNEAGSEMTVPLSGRVRFEWKILNGNGRFVKLGCLYTNKENDQFTQGDQVIFMPPVVPLPVIKNDTAVISEIRLSIIDAIEGPSKDVQVDSFFKIITTRFRDKPDVYKIEIVYKYPNKFPQKPFPSKPTGVCIAMKGDWIKEAPLKKPVISLPNVADNNSMVLGQLIVLEAEDQQETDELPGILCKSPDCPYPPAISHKHPDNIQWEWGKLKGKGRFPAGLLGRYVIYEAPTSLDPGETETEITLKVKNGDGLTCYEEYRGFKIIVPVIKASGFELPPAGGPEHVRSDFRVKTIFIRNGGGLPISLYRKISGLEVFEITEPQYGSDNVRIVNFNYNPKTNVVKQLGLNLVLGKTSGTLLGKTFTTNGEPARPNEVKMIVIYLDFLREHIAGINAKVDAYNKDVEKREKFKNGFKYLNEDDKIAAVVAHELLHANNVCHHGEGDEGLVVSHDAMNGLRSGDLICVMRYDNTGTQIKDTVNFPEKPGTNLCNSPKGTSYNGPQLTKGGVWVENVKEVGWGNCAAGRGNCAKQMHISGVGKKPDTCPAPPMPKN